MDNPLQGLSLDGQLAPALASSKVPVAAIEGVSYSFWTSNVWGQVEERMLDTLAHLGAAKRSDPGLETASAITMEAHRLRTQLLPFSGDKGVTSPVVYPKSDDSFPQRLAGLAALLAAGLPLRCVALSAPGAYDTHADQAGALATGLDLTAQSLLAFQRDLEARGLADRVLVHVWSEFGRRAQENGSAGTDHGAAGVGFVVGSQAAGGSVGEFPGLSGAGLDDDGNVARDLRLPRRLLRAARAVARRRRRARDPGRERLRPAETGSLVAFRASASPACNRTYVRLECQGMQLRLDAADRLVELVEERRGPVAAEEAARRLFALRRLPDGVAKGLLEEAVRADARLAWRGDLVALAEPAAESLPLELARFVVVDLETTGLSPATARICEIGAVRVEALELTARFETLANPGVRLAPAVGALTGIDDRDLRDGAARRRGRAALPRLRRRLGARRPQRALRPRLPRPRDRAADREADRGAGDRHGRARAAAARRPHLARRPRLAGAVLRHERAPVPPRAARRRGDGRDPALR